MKNWFVERKNCDNQNCDQLCFGVAKTVLWGMFFSAFIVGPKLLDSWKIILTSDVNTVGVLESNILFWLAVWVASIALVAHEKINNFLTLMINSMAVPGFVLGIFSISAG